MEMPPPFNDIKLLGFKLKLVSSRKWLIPLLRRRTLTANSQIVAMTTTQYEAGTCSSKSGCVS
jgi:hypothetical protein